MTSKNASMLSMHAFGLPGKLTISVLPRMTDAPRESIARGVMAIDAARMASAIPGALRSATAMVASGVTSRKSEAKRS